MGTVSATNTLPPGMTFGAGQHQSPASVRVRACIQGLIDLWDRGEPVEIQTEFAPAGLVIWSLANHSVELSRSILALSSQDRLVVSVPLIRLLIENLVTSEWLYLMPNAGRALIHEGLRTKVAGMREATERGTDGFTQESLDSWMTELASFGTDASVEGRSFQARCHAVVGGDELYTTWRVASALSHAGLAMSDFYLISSEASDEYPLGVGVARSRKLPGHEYWLGVAAAALLRAIKAYDLVSLPHGLAGPLDLSARQLGVNLEVRLADDDSADASDE